MAPTRSSPADPPSPAHTRAVIGLGLPRPRHSRVAWIVALLVHVGLIWLVVRVVPELDFAPAAGDPLGLASGGGGGGGGRVVRLAALPAAPQPRPVVPPPQPATVPLAEPVPEPVDVPPVPADSAPSPPADSAGASGAGPGEGTGRGPGTGSGEGGGSGSGRGTGTGAGRGPGTGGEGGSARAPEPRQLILPPADVPGSLRGTTIAVTFEVGPDGRVVDVQFEPEPGDRGFGRKLEEVMRGYRFRPARGEDGRPVAGRTTVTLTF